ncbi:hypothetical protein D3C78_20420 [compost metagenome]
MTKSRITTTLKIYLSCGKVACVEDIVYVNTTDVMFSTPDKKFTDLVAFLTDPMIKPNKITFEIASLIIYKNHVNLVQQSREIKNMSSYTNSQGTKVWTNEYDDEINIADHVVTCSIEDP